ncbi:MAG: hypothetical protein Q7S21_04330 [archaeon]|nr:hypothetical protein [archaeon]
MQLFEGNYKRYLIIPIILYLVFAFSIVVFPGLKQGIDLKGGTLIIIRSSEPIEEARLESLLESKFDLSETAINTTSSPTGNGATIEFAENTKLAPIKQELELAQSLIDSDPTQARIHAMNVINSLPEFVEGNIPINEKETVVFAENVFDKAQIDFELKLQQEIQKEFNLENDFRFQLREVGSSLGESFWQNAITITIASMILIIIVVFVFFREVVPSLAIIAAAIFDILCALGLMAWFGVNLTLATIPAVLSLVGYSIGTDILLTTRLLKRKEKTSSERTMDAFKTGITMTITTLVAVIVLLGFAYFYQMLIVFEISIVLLFGLIGDVISTWMMNAPVLLMYLEKKKASA